MSIDHATSGSMYWVDGSKWSKQNREKIDNKELSKQASDLTKGGNSYEENTG